jgi:hypothetical protein
MHKYASVYNLQIVYYDITRYNQKSQVNNYYKIVKINKEVTDNEHQQRRLQQND